MSQLQPYSAGRQSLDPIQPQVLPTVPVDVDTSPESLSLVGFSHLLRRRWKLVFFSTLCGLLVAVLVSMSQDRVYRAEAALEIQQMNENFLNLKDLQPTAPSAAFREDAYMHTQAEMLAQPALIERVVKNLGLDKQPELISSGGVGENIRGVMGKGTPDAGYRLQYAVQLSKDNLKIVPLRQSRILAVRYEARDPKVAASFANGLAQTFIEQSIEARWNAAQQIREWLRPQIEDLRGQLSKAEGELQAYSRATGLMATAERETLAEDRLRSLQSELSRAQADRMAREPIYQMANSGRGEALDESPLIRDHQLRLSELRRQMADLNTVLNPESYKVQRLQAQINEVEAALQKETSKGRTRVRDGFEAATKRERLLSAAVDNQTGIVSNVASRMVHYNTLKQRVETTRAFYENLLSKANEAGVASAIRPSNIRIVNQATPPLYPARPNIPLNAGLGAMAGLFLGFGFLFMSEHAPRRI